MSSRILAPFALASALALAPDPSWAAQATPAPVAPKPRVAPPPAAKPQTSKPSVVPVKPTTVSSSQPKPAAAKPAAPKPATAVRPTAAKATAAKPSTPKPASRKPTTPPTSWPSLKPGQFRWMPELSPQGPVVVVVSLPEQLVHVYRNGVRIGVSTISSGMPGFETGTGIFPILERETEHYSNLYDNAPMPYMLRLTWSGTALHAGHLPGRPASHGCVRLPKAFAQLLFDAVRRGTVVVIADAASHPATVVVPGWTTPVDPATGAVVPDPGTAEVWAPERAADGPVSLLLSTRDRRLVVLRNGIEIGRTEAAITGEIAPGTRAHALHADAPAPIQTDPRLIPTVVDPATTLPPPAPVLRWQAMPEPGKRPATGLQAPLRGGSLQLGETFARQLQPLLSAETTLVITDEPLRPAPATPAPPTPGTPATTPPTPVPTPSPEPPPAPTPPPSPEPLPEPPDSATPVTPAPPTPAQTQTSTR